MLKYIELVNENRPQFEAKVIEIAGKLNIPPDWLMLVMESESGLSHTIVNPMGGATGLIQFMPSTAKGLGTTTTALKRMSNVQQLDYVYKYFRPYKKQLQTGYDLYSINFFPAMLGKPDDWEIHSDKLSAETIAKYNKSLDLDHNNVITVAEWKKSLDKKFKKAGVDPKKKA